jgi:hypothetical protein
MKITKEKDCYLFKNTDGEYHLSHEQYDKLGNAEAIKLAELEIEKKKSSSYSKKTINFKDARDLGFCEYGIKDFCNVLNLDIEKEYEVEILKNNLTKEVALKYPDECLKLFGKSLFDNFGGVIDFLVQNKNEKAFDLVVKSKIVDDEKLHLLACSIATTTLKNFELIYPSDNRPRLAVEAKIKWLKKEISDNELGIAWSAAESAAKSAAKSAASYAAWSAAESAAKSAASYAAKSATRSAASYAAWSSTRSAAESAASYAASSAAWSAASYAAKSAAWEEYCDMLIKELEK